MRTRALAAIAALATVTTSALLAQAPAPDPGLRIWTGVYSAAQAERGRAVFMTSCANCHSADLSGGAGPSLSGSRFMTRWDSEALTGVFRTIRDTMPRSEPGRLSDSATIDIVAFILQANAFPAGATDLAASADVLDSVLIVPKTGPTRRELPNFALVQVVGCLSGSGRAWTLSDATAPVATKDVPASEAELREATARAAGDEAFRLISVLPFEPGPKNGQRVAVKGILNRTSAGALLNVTALQTVSERC
jgi:quinoprotein glucose dehydrogenase